MRKESEIKKVRSERKKDRTTGERRMGELTERKERKR